MISIYLINGIKLQGKLIDYDDTTLWIDGNLIYKHAISTIGVGNKNESK